MNWLINEVQITCMILMLLTSIVLGILIPYYVYENKVVKRARQYLAVSMFLGAVHFLLQYIMHKQGYVEPDSRTIINLLFGLPISFTFSMSLLYTQRNGVIKRIEFLYVPIVFSLSLIALAAVYLPPEPYIKIGVATKFMSITYASAIAFFYIQQFKEYLRIRKNIKSRKDLSQEILFKWSELPMFLIFSVGFLLPIMTFNTDMVLRSLCGLYVLSVSFIYISCFIGYDLTIYAESFAKKEKQETIPQRKEKTKEPLETEDTEYLNEEKLKKIEIAVQKFKDDKFYLKSGITLKEVADEMCISRAALHAWLLTTEYKKFNNWLMVLRIEEAKRLLMAHPNWSNETIAKSCGYCDRSYFQRQFSEIVGISPSKWVKDLQNNSEQ